MKKLHAPSHRTGFTLVEVLLYIGIFTVIISAIVGLLILATAQRVKNQVIADVNYQGEAVMASLTTAVHGAGSVTAPALGAASPSLTLAMPNPTVNPTVYDAFSDGTTSRLRLAEGSPAVQTNLTNSHVTVSGLSFSNVGLAGSKGSIKVQFTLSYNNPSGNDSYNFSRTFYGSADLQ